MVKGEKPFTWQYEKGSTWRAFASFGAANRDNEVEMNCRDILGSFQVTEEGLAGSQGFENRKKRIENTVEFKSHLHEPTLVLFRAEGNENPMVRKSSNRPDSTRLETF